MEAKLRFGKHLDLEAQTVVKAYASHKKPADEVRIQPAEMVRLL